MKRFERNLYWFAGFLLFASIVASVWWGIRAAERKVIGEADLFPAIKWHGKNPAIGVGPGLVWSDRQVVVNPDGTIGWADEALPTEEAKE